MNVKDLNESDMKIGELIMLIDSDTLSKKQISLILNCTLYEYTSSALYHNLLLAEGK